MPDYTMGSTELQFTSPEVHRAKGREDETKGPEKIVFKHGPIAPVKYSDEDDPDMRI